MHFVNCITSKYGSCRTSNVATCMVMQIIQMNHFAALAVSSQRRTVALPASVDGGALDLAVPFWLCHFGCAISAVPFRCTIIISNREWI